MQTSAAGRWWVPLIRGSAAILFGVLTFVWPASSLVTLVLLFGAYALVDGALNLATAITQRDTHVQSRGWLVLQGLAGIAAAVVTFYWPGITALSLLFLIAGWAVVTGIAAIVMAIRLRKQITREWLLVLNGLLSLAFGALLFMFPGAGALAVVLWIGAWALVHGALLVFLSFRIRAWGEKGLPTDRTALPV